MEADVEIFLFQDIKSAEEIKILLPQYETYAKT